MSAHERDLRKAVKKSFSKVAKEVKRFVQDGLGENVGRGSTWSLSDETYVHAVLGRGRLRVRLIVHGAVIAELDRGASRPGVRDADMDFLEKMVDIAPNMVVDRLLLSMREVLGCGDPYEEVRQVLGLMSVTPWSCHD